MIYRTQEGTILPVTLELIDEDDQPILCQSGYPKVAILDDDKSVISSVIATPSATPGVWLATLSVPNFGLDSAKEYVVKWKAVDRADGKHTFSDSLTVEPAVDERDSEIVVLFGDLAASVLLPTKLDSGDTCKYQIYKNNEAIYPAVVEVAYGSPFLDNSLLANTKLTIDLTAIPDASLYSYLLKVDVIRANGASSSYLYNAWVITPQLFKCMTQLEAAINKSRINNVIPELRYCSSDLLMCLERGLNYFNLLEKPTFFTGLNMQGVLYDAHLICSEYWALSAQILAEGSLAFDFSGQSISLNVDRTPALEAALGRLESIIESRFIPLKKELAKNGIKSGDGSVGSGNMNNPRAKGLLTVINAPTTKLPLQTATFRGRRY